MHSTIYASILTYNTHVHCTDVQRHSTRVIELCCRSAGDIRELPVDLNK